jgi:hypothetical protein
MQVALNDKNVSPLDATLESVMPGVHQRFVAMDGTLKTLDRKIVSGFDKLDTIDNKVDGLADHFNYLQANNRERDGNCADHLRTLAARLRAGDGSSPPPLSPPTRPQQQQVQQSPNRVGDNQPPPSPADAASGRRHRMVPKHHSIQLLFDEWYGLGDSLDKPVIGGISALETRYKSKWCNHFLASEKKNFSRSQMVIRAILTTVKNTNETLDTIIDSFELPYEVDAKLPMAKMATIVQEHGLVTKKKSRGKTKK